MTVLQAGRRLGAYDVQSLIGRGGMAEVYRATHTTLGRAAAIKVLNPALHSDPSFPRRFLREARMAASLNHPHIVTVYDFGEEQDLAYLVMELATGGTLRDRARELHTLGAVVEVLATIGSALQYAHERGIVHRDLKPLNVLVCDDRLLLADFGLATIAMQSLDSSQTGGSAVIGTPRYMAPEQVRGETADQRSDLYALGIIAYELLAGRVPYHGDSALAVMQQQISAPLPSLRATLPGAPPALEAVLHRAMAKRPVERFASVAEFVAALQAAASPVAALPIGGALHAESDDATVPARQGMPVSRAAGDATVQPAGAVAPGTSPAGADRPHHVCEGASIATLPAPDRLTASPNQRGTGGAPAAPVRGTTPPAMQPPTNVHAPLTSFVGREPELAGLARLLTNHRLVTLTGAGGTGKTRLALEFANLQTSRFPDGVFFVDLASLDDPLLIPSAIAGVLGVQEQAGIPVRDSIAAVLRTKQALLILDNYEHLLAAADLTVALLQAAPALTLLVTSRAPLRVGGECEYAVPPLPLPAAPASAGSVPADWDDNPALCLFVARAEAVRADFALTDDESIRAVAAICRQLDGLPLAIELAAARVRVLPPAALLARLTQRLPLLTGGRRDLPARQQTLRDTIGWSYALLEAQEQRLFRQLAVFAGGCTLEAATAVAAADDEIAVLDGLSSLVEKSLLRRSDGAGGDVRFSMLETIREYAHEQLVAHGEALAAQQRHAACFVALSEAAADGLRGATRPSWDARLNAEQENLRAAWQWSVRSGSVEPGLALIGALHLWLWRTMAAEGLRWADSLLLIADSTVAPHIRAQALTAAGALSVAQRDLAAAARYLTASLALRQEAGKEQDRAYSQAWLAIALPDEPGRARELAEASVACFRASNDDWHLGIALLALGMVTPVVAEKWEILEQSLRHFRAVGDTWWVAAALGALAGLALEAGDDARARLIAEEGLVTSRAAGDRVNEAALLIVLGWESIRSQALDQAGRYFRQALQLRQAMGQVAGLGSSLERIAMVEAERQRYETAAVLFAAADQLQPAHSAAADLAVPGRVSRDAALERVRSALGVQPFTAAWEIGQALTPAEAVARALTP